MKITSLFAAAAMVASVGIAQADEPMRLSEASMDNVTAGRVFAAADVRKYVDTYNDSYLNQYKRVDSDADVLDNLADAEAIADAYGDDSFTETLTATEAYDFRVGSYSGSISAVE